MTNPREQNYADKRSLVPAYRTESVIQISIPVMESHPAPSASSLQGSQSSSASEAEKAGSTSVLSESKSRDVGESDDDAVMSEKRSRQKRNVNSHHDLR